MDKKNYRDIAQLKGELWVASNKIRGIGHLIKYQNVDYLPEPEESAGIGEILCDIGHDISEICEYLDGSLTITGGSNAERCNR